MKRWNVGKIGWLIPGVRLEPFERLWRSFAPVQRTWVLVAVALLVLAVPGRAWLARHPAWLSSPVNLLHRVGLTRWQAEPFERVRQLPYHIVEKRTSKLPIGQSRLSGAGHPGQAHSWGLTYISGSSRITHETASETVRTPKNGQLWVGTGHTIVVNGHHYKFTKMLQMTATAYDATWKSNGRWTGQPSQMGVPLHHGIAAVDPKVIPLGTWLYVDGYGLALAADTGSAIHGKRIDLFFDAPPKQVMDFGIQHVVVYELDRPRVMPGPNAAKTKLPSS